MVINAVVISHSDPGAVPGASTISSAPRGRLSVGELQGANVMGAN